MGFDWEIRARAFSDLGDDRATVKAEACHQMHRERQYQNEGLGSEGVRAEAWTARHPTNARWAAILDASLHFRRVDGRNR